MALQGASRSFKLLGHVHADEGLRLSGRKGNESDDNIESKYKF